MSITNFLNKIKAKNNVDKFTFLYLIIIIGVGVSSFCLGRLSVDIRDDDKTDNLYINEDNNFSDNYQKSDGVYTQQQGEKRFVASKNGKMYYSLGCSGAKRIKPENEIWFSTKEEAEKSGYSLSSLCK